MTEHVEVEVKLAKTGQVFFRHVIALTTVDFGAEVTPFIDAVTVDVELLNELAEIRCVIAGRGTRGKVQALTKADQVPQVGDAEMRLLKRWVDRFDVLVAARLI